MQIYSGKLLTIGKHDKETFFLVNNAEQEIIRPAFIAPDFASVVKYIYSVYDVKAQLGKGFMSFFKRG